MSAINSVWLCRNADFELTGVKNNTCTKIKDSFAPSHILSSNSFAHGELRFTFDKTEKSAVDVPYAVGAVNEKYAHGGVGAYSWEYSTDTLIIRKDNVAIASYPVAVGSRITVLLSVDQKTIEFSCNGVVQGKWTISGDRFWAACWMTKANARISLNIEMLSNLTTQKPRDFAWTWASRRAHILRYAHLPLNFLVVGRFGVGKSSFFNTLCTALQPANVTRIREPVLVGSGTGEKGHGTEAFNIFEIPDTNFHALDLWGWDEKNFREGELKLVAYGKMLSGYKKDDKDNSNADKVLDQVPPFEKWTHSVILAVDAEGSGDSAGLHTFSGTVMSNMPQNLGFHQLVVLVTRVDAVIDPELRKSPEKVYSSLPVKQAMANLQTILKVPESVVFPLKNYHAERERNFLLEALVLDAFATAVDQAVQYFQHVVRKVDQKAPLATPVDVRPGVDIKKEYLKVETPKPDKPSDEIKDPKDANLKAIAVQAEQDEEKAADTKMEYIGPSKVETEVEQEVDTFAWSKFQKEADSLSLFLRSMNYPAKDARRRARIGVTMASGNMRQALAYAISDEFNLTPKPQPPASGP